MSEPTSRLSTALADRYRIERPLGEGGMATVHLAEDLKHERRVAIKVLKPELAAVIGGEERFVAEIKTTAQLQHPHILPLFDSGETDGPRVSQGVDAWVERGRLESYLGVWTLRVFGLPIPRAQIGSTRSGGRFTPERHPRGVGCRRAPPGAPHPGESTFRRRHG